MHMTINGAHVAYWRQSRDLFRQYTTWCL